MQPTDDKRSETTEHSLVEKVIFHVVCVSGILAVHFGVAPLW